VAVRDTAELNAGNLIVATYFKARDRNYLGAQSDFNFVRQRGDAIEQTAKLVLLLVRARL
jgi:hypothetical protein